MAVGMGGMSTDDFCDAFFHVKPTPEAGVCEPCCLRPPPACCSGKQTALVAQLLGADGTVLYTALHRNVSQRDHAEDLLMRDERLLSTAAAASAANVGGGAAVRVWLTIQPCHFSSGDDTRSCTLALLQWHERALKPRGVSFLEIKAAYPYRAHWDPAHMPEDDLVQLGRRTWAGGGGRGGGSRGRWGYRGGRQQQSSRPEAIERAHALLQSAREGTRLLVNARAAGVTLEPFSSLEDWEKLARICCSEATAAQWAERVAPFTASALDVRARMDRFTKAVFDSYRDTLPRRVEPDADGHVTDVATTGTSSSTPPAAGAL